MAAHYQDSLFRSLFNNPPAVAELYNAIKGTRFGPRDQVVINTLTETLFTDRKNDLAATINNRLLLITEHQSTVNPNMPFRFLDSVVRLLQNGITSRKAVYQGELVALQWPECMVLYCGRAPCPAYRRLRLSDAFYRVPGLEAPHLELQVDVYNINVGQNAGILAKSRLLGGYAAFVEKVRGYTAAAERSGVSREEAVERAVSQAVAYCKAHDILKEYWEKLSLEETKMLTGEWKLEEALEVWRDEALRKGWNEGRNKALELMRGGYTADQIERMLAVEPGGGLLMEA